MPKLRIREAAAFVGVSEDTLRRVVDAGELPSELDGSGRKVVDGADLAQYVRRRATAAPDPVGVVSSARNRFVGLVTGVRSDAVMAQVDMQCGPFRVVSLMSSEAVAEMGLEPGSVAVAVVKSTNVIVETPGPVR